MPDLFPSLTRLILPSLCTRKCSNGGARGWINAARYSVAGPPNQAGELDLTTAHYSFYADSISFDYERFALAAYETWKVSQLEKTNANLSAWPLLKLYYSAFFSAHAILRAMGHSVSLLDSANVNVLNEILALQYQNPASIPSGHYTIKTDISGPGQNIRVRIAPQVNKGGVHESFWLTFIKILKSEAAHAQINNMANANKFFSGVADIEAALINCDQSRCWISRIRNEINYRHLHEVWYPFTKKNSCVSALSHVSEPSSNILLHSEANKKKNPIKSFITSCRYVISLSLEISEKLGNNPKVGGSFPQKWERLRCQTTQL